MHTCVWMCGVNGGKSGRMDMDDTHTQSSTVHSYIQFNHDAHKQTCQYVGGGKMNEKGE